MKQFSLAEARRIAIAAQGLHRPGRERAVTAGDIRRAIRAMGLLQLDYVKVVGPAHLMILFSRLGPFDLELFERAAYGRCGFTEQWAHEASLIPVETWPLLRFRMEGSRFSPTGMDAFLARHPDYCETVLAQVRERGPVAASGIAVPDGIDRRLPESWWGSIPRAALEMLFARGRLVVAARPGGLTRVFDLPERLLPAEVLERRIDAHEAQRELLLIAARGCGIGTAADLADYFRQRAVRPRLEELADEGRLIRVEVEGWREPAFLHPGARCPRTSEASTLLSPFDPLVRYRPRLKRLFGFDYRFEIFVPEAQRRWGTYVLPFLQGDLISARVDLKADRVRRHLVVQAAYIEEHASASVTAPALARELGILARWLNLEHVVVRQKGNLARNLRRSVS